ncbi:MAG: PIN domain-containing protein [Streptosporangiaceae bacterium]
MSVLLDAGPTLNFLAVGQQTVLISVADKGGLQLTVPQRVDHEVLGMCRDPRFARTPAQATWRKLRGSGRVVVVPDELTTTVFTDAVTRISGVPASERVKARRSLGEIMVLAHASSLAQGGADVFVLLDDGDGRVRCKREQGWLERNGASGQLVLWSTRQVLKQADPSWFAGGLTWQQVYERMREFDDGLLAL